MCGVTVQVSALVSETRSHWALGSLNGPRWSVSEPRGPAVSVSPGLGLQIANITTTPRFLHECQGSNSDPPIHTASTLPLKYFLGPKLGILTVCCHVIFNGNPASLSGVTAPQRRLPDLMGPSQPCYH